MQTPQRIVRSFDLHPDARVAIVYGSIMLLGRLVYAVHMNAGPGTFQPLLPRILPALCATLFFGMMRFERLTAFTSALLVFNLGAIAMGFMASFCMMSGAPFPLADARLEAIDRSLGFDWIAMMRWVDSHAWIEKYLFWYPYESVWWQPFLIVPILLYCRNFRPAFMLLGAITTALTLCSIVAVIVPAYGTYQYLGVHPSDHPHLVLDVRDRMGAMIDWMRAGHPELPKPKDAAGLISFPSFHTVAAILYVWAVWRLPYVRWIALLWNTLMLAATPLEGSHYIIDVFGGVGVALASIGVVAWIHQRQNIKPLIIPSLPLAHTLISIHPDPDRRELDGGKEVVGACRSA